MAVTVVVMMMVMVMPTSCRHSDQQAQTHGKHTRTSVTPGAQVQQLEQIQLMTIWMMSFTEMWILRLF